MNWILGLGKDDQHAVILWLYGPAGAGKTAIAHTIAERCDLEKLLLASFFFSRADPARNNSKSLIATIAYQIAIRIPGMREKIVAAVERDPLILTLSMEAQINALVVEPLQEQLEEGYFNAPANLRRLIIIDGLDECDNSAAQCSILEIISRLFHHYHLPFLIFIASRPERHLTHCFSTGSLPEFHTTLALDDTYKADNDIRLFLADNFMQIKDTHPMRRYLDHSWPSVDVLDGLVRKSSGQFIYASTVVKYVSSIRHQPTDRLNVILGIRPPRHAREMPFGELDALYTHIFSSVEERETVRLLIGFRLLSSSRAFQMDAEALEHFFLLNPGDLELLFGDLCSVISISNVLPPIHILHASLGDFLLDTARSKELYIDPSSIHTTCMHLCFQHIKQRMSVCFSWKDAAVYRLIDSADDGGGRHLSYARRNLIWHCENTPPSAYSQLREEMLNFPFDRPDSCFRASRETSLFFYVPQFLSFIKAFVRPNLFIFRYMTQCIEHLEQPIDDADEIYNKSLAMVLDFFASKLPLYYSSARLTLLLTFLSTSAPDYLRTYIIPLPSRLKITDDDALALHEAAGYNKTRPWQIFQDFLESSDPLALDERRYAVAALASLKILFGHSQPPVSPITWFSQHSRTCRVHMNGHSQWRHKDFPLATYLTDLERNFAFYWYLRTHFNQTPQKQSLWNRFSQFTEESKDQFYRSNHLLFLLPKSAYSHNILNFARYRVFRFAYPHRNHPTYMKRAIFALAKYIERVTGETAEVKACQSIWGRDRWFSAQFPRSLHST